MQRAAVHAALGDPARLGIVDLLMFGDRSPGELQAELDMPSNLMAHHLRVLEGSGLVGRHRSEADRRRSYLQLNRALLGGLLSRGGLVAPRVVFVCTANSARSHLADALWRRVSSVPSTSAGTHPADRVASGAIDVARRHGVDLPDVQPRALDAVADGRDLVITVCDRAHEEIRNGSLHWSVPDPVAAGTAAAFEHAFELLAERIGELAPLVAAA